MDQEKLYGVIARWFNGRKSLFSQKKDPKKKEAWRRSWYAQNAVGFILITPIHDVTQLDSHDSTFCS
jgi:hypothetical protein